MLSGLIGFIVGIFAVRRRHVSSALPAGRAGFDTVPGRSANHADDGRRADFDCKRTDHQQNRGKYRLFPDCRRQRSSLPPCCCSRPCNSSTPLHMMYGYG